MSSRAHFVSVAAAPRYVVAIMLVALSGCGPEIAIGGDVDCMTDDACGPALGAPAVSCWDGTLGGNTGRCVRTPGGLCGWLLRDCPALPSCDESECDSQARPVRVRSECERDTDGVCRWIPTSPCTLSDCAPRPATDSWLCQDGSQGGFTGRCVPQGSVCEWEYNDCIPATDACDVADCGPIPTTSALCGCSGSDCGARCVRNGFDECEWELPVCSTRAACGSDTECESSEFCAYAVADSCGESLDAQGACMPRAVEADCTLMISTGIPESPVCGCDGITYASRCHASVSNVRVRFDGACEGYQCAPSANASTDRCITTPLRPCDEGTTPRYDADGCPTTECVSATSCECASARDCPESAPVCNRRTLRCTAS